MKSFWNFLRHNKLYGAINLMGLTVSMAFVLLLAVYVRRQISTDSFQENADRIYVIANEESVNNAYWMDKHLKREFPEIEKGCSVTCISHTDEFTIDGEIVSGYSMAADSTFFDIFSYSLVSGNRTDWALSSDRCMISREFANAYFTDKDPVGHTIIYNSVSNTSFTICGVYNDFGSSILSTPDVLIRGEIMKSINPFHDEHMSNAVGTVCFVMTYPGVDLIARHDDILEWCEENSWAYESNFDDVRIIPLKDVHFLDEGSKDWSGTIVFGRRRLVMLLLVMCIALLLFAVLNYVNMTTALAGFRAKEMATRRLVGAGRRSIFYKTVAESTIMCGTSMVIAVLLAQVLSPGASLLLSDDFSVFGAITPLTLFLLTAFTLLLGFAAGIVPALLILKAEPIEIIRGTLRFKIKTVYSKIIIILQNAVVLVMLVSTLTMILQVKHLVSSDLGYNTEDVMVMENNFGSAGYLRPLLDALRSDSLVEEVGMGMGIPLGGTNNGTMEISDGQWVSFQHIEGDDAYFQILGLEVKQDNHIPDAFWLNEYAFKQIGIDETVTSFQTVEDGTWNIGGIYKDFKINPLEDEQSAALIFNWGTADDNSHPWNLLIKTGPDHIAARQRIERIVSEVFPGKEAYANYYDEVIASSYASELVVIIIVVIFTLLSILVSALGMYAMCSYHMLQEIQTVSIKKVFGASYSEVFRGLVRSFMKLVGIAFVIGVPVAWGIMNQWLSGYEHRISLHWWIFAVSGLGMLLISVISVLHQSKRTASTNPVAALNKNQ